MSENNVNGITGAEVTTTGIIGATVAIGQYIINDYVITIAQAEDEYGYTMTITKGTQTQTVTLYGLTPEQYDAMLSYLEQAQAAAQSAQSAAQSAEGSASDADAYMEVAINAANTANTQAGRATQASNTAQSYASQAQTAKQGAETAKTDAQTARTQAQGYRQAAEAAATRAETAAGEITGMTAEAETIEPGSPATASFLDGVLSLGIPAGETGNGIVSIIKTGTQGNVDTYTITYTNGTTSTFTVTNGTDGAVQSVAGKTGTVTLDAGDVSFDDQQSYDDGTVGAGLADLKSQMGVVDSVALGAYPTDTASGAVVRITDGADDLPLKALTVEISSETGVTGATIVRRGKNVFDQALMKDQAGWNIIKFYAPVGTVLTMSTDRADSGATGLLAYFRLPGETQSNSNKVYASHPVTRTVPEAGYVEIVQRRASGEDSFASYQYQIEVGSSASDFEAYSAAEYAFDWTDAAGAITEGTLDALNGTLTTGGDSFQLTPAEPLSLLGNNTIWADVGEVAVTWRADPTLYADKRTSATRSLITGIEPTMTASKAYSVGQLLIVGDTLYKVAASIASGATLTPGTNVTQTTVAEQLILLANA